MHTKRTTFPTKMTIGIDLEELKQCTEIETFLLLEYHLVRKTSKFENVDLYRTNWQKRYFDALVFHAIAPDMCSSGELENILTTNYR